ncbi:MAG TPA: formyltetrahydrofolate deformylase, partial [Treponema sp.]|nr:formyltetrahydrofolate deformylase [Treponema sp.]
AFTEERFTVLFSSIAKKFTMDWHLFDNNKKDRIALLVSKTSHCLYELLLKHADGELDCEIPVIISNHPDLAHIATSFHIPFYKVDPAKGKDAYEADIQNILEEYRIDLVVLARYMQVLGAKFCQKWESRIINIHHGFLPAFKGARPYHQAWQKGVKIIGATGHFATEDLDQGPIIYQDIIRVADTCSVNEFIRMGKDVERRVIVEAVRRYIQHSIFLHKGRTFVIE